MYIDKFKIIRDGETVAVMAVGTNKVTGEETLKPVAYVRDLLGALLSVRRKMTADAVEKATDLKACIQLLEEQYQGITDLVKANCKDCLNE